MAEKEDLLVSLQASPSIHSAPRTVTAATRATVTSAPLVQPGQVTGLRLETCEMKKSFPSHLEHYSVDSYNSFTPTINI